MSIFSFILLFFALTQIYWAWRIYRFLGRHIRSRAALWVICACLAVAYFAGYQYNLGAWRERSSPVHMTWGDALLTAPFTWWAVSSLVAAVLLLLFAIPHGIVAGARRMRLSDRPPVEHAPDAPTRRDVLEQAATVVAAAPFVA